MMTETIDEQKKPMYVAMRLNKTVNVSVGGIEKTVPLSYLDGMIGVIPVFESAEKAKLYLNGIGDVFAITVSD